MGAKLIIMGGLALTFGATSYYAGNQYLESHAQARLNAWESNQPKHEKIDLSKVVVANADLKFGEKLTEEHLTLVSWPSDHRPEGSFNSIEEILDDGNRRVVTAMHKGEAVLAIKLTGKNGRGGLAGVISEGMRAVTIPVNMVDGVGGFVQPGDRVDIVFTHEDPKTDATSTRIIMTKVKVLSVDQDAKERSSAAQVAKSVTLETDTKGAQKLALARNIGKLSLLLRSAGDDTAAESQALSLNELAGGVRPESPDQEGGLNGLLSYFQDDEKKKVTSIRVIKRDVTDNVTVPIEEVAAEAKSNEEKPGQ